MRVFIVEDDQLLRDNLVVLLEGESQLEVTGAVDSAEAALQRLARASPEVLLVDLGLPGMPGVELIRRTKEQWPHVEILAHTVYEDRETVFAAIKAGASGYILKGCQSQELVEALFSLHQGGAPMSPKIARAVIREFQQDTLDEQYLLTPREKDVLVAVEKGLIYKEIASLHHISPHTVHAHIKNIYDKLHARSRREALVTARRKGIL